MTFNRLLPAALIAAVGILVFGCAKSGPGDAPAATVAAHGHDHHGWWCDEHGVPEGECSMCSAKVAKAFQDKGDWCKEHDRAKSQCFICDPSLREKYAATYRAKNGKEPPEPTENMPKKEEKKSK